MIAPAYVRTMAAYNAEMNRRTYAAADTLTEAQRQEDAGAFFKSLHGTLCHLLWADHGWMSRFAGWAGRRAGASRPITSTPGARRRPPCISGSASHDH
ncbi:MAG TPA: DinB family protein, partial [Roseococcus sp.]|nr:DinB family protein [Roseococcus sp.]